MRPGIRKSVVWDYFKKSEDNKMVTCTLCKKNFKHHGNTTNLNKHIKSVHPIQYNQSTESGNQQLQSIITSIPVTDKSDLITEDLINEENIQQQQQSSNHSPPLKRKRQLKLTSQKNYLTESEIKEIDNCIIKMVVTDYQPLTIVENTGFLELCNKLQPLYKPPSRKVLSTKLLPEIYNEKKIKIKYMLNSVNNVAVTTDMWSSDSNKSYITATAHFIYNNKLFAPVIATREVLETHTGKNIADVLSNIFDEWNINDKIVTVVSDNGANIKNAINDHLHKHNHPCVAHTLNLSVKEALEKNEALNQILKKCRNVVAHFKHSASASNKLKEIQTLMNAPQLKVKQDVSTRWNSTLTMIERLTQIKDPLSIAIINLPKAPDNLDAFEWSVIVDCIPILKPIELMTSELSGEKYPTMSIIIPLIRGLQFSIKNNTTNTDIGLSLKSALLETISRRLVPLETNKIVAKATFLDPRIKKLAFGLDENAKNAQKWVFDEVIQLMSKHDTNTMAHSSKDSIGTSTMSKNSIWSYFDTKVAQNKTIITPSTTVTLMLRQYIEMPILQRNSDPLEFWKTNKSVFPQLYELHLKYLSIPATSVPSERVFSKAGQLTNIRRNRLSPKNLDQIIFLNSAF